MLSLLLTSTLALAPVHIDPPEEKITEMSRLVVQSRDRLVHQMASDGAFEEQDDRYLGVLEAIHFALERGRTSDPKLGVTLVLWQLGEVRNPEVIMGSILRNVVTPREIKKHFGNAVSKVVGEMVASGGVDSRTNEAKLVQLAEMIWTLRELESPANVDWAGIGATPWTQVRKDKYARHAEKSIGTLRGVSPALEAELDRLLAKHREEVARRRK